MKELTIEQKAKAYDGNYKTYTELINRLEGVKNAIKKQNYGIAMDILCKPYPEYQITTSTELKESEDERIRREIIDVIRHSVNSMPADKFNERIAWLEEQGQHKKFRDSIQVGDKVARNEDGVLVNLSQLERIAKPNESKQVEQTSDKIEPKFKIGDWLQYRNAKPFFVEEITKQGYVNGDSCLPFNWENEIHLWTIQDAKDGDVLVSESNCGLNTWYCIFKSLDDDESMTVHCYLTRDGRFQTMEELCFNKDPRNVKPATKEQRDTLERAMSNAGYTFDFEKKELKKVENEIEIPFGAKDSELQEATYYIPKGFHAEIEGNNVIIKKGEHNPACGEEDEKCIRLCTDIIDSALRAGFCVQLDRDRCVDWLKSLKERYTWKPSDEQMKALYDSIPEMVMAISEREMLLNSLYKDLRKLREE